MAVFKFENALIPYFTFADPDIDFTETLVMESFKAGADAIELGIPFSDPIADGPIVQASHQRALEKNPHLSITQALTLVKKIKKSVDKPLIFMAATNLIHKYGVASFFEDAASHKLDGIIIPDLPIEEAKDFLKASKKSGVALILLLSPLTEGDRFSKIVSHCDGFLYLISTTGTTGERKQVAGNLADVVKRVKALRKNLPVCVGFGISEPAHLKEVSQYADGAIVGSHFIRLMENEFSDRDKAVRIIVERIKAFKKAV